MKPAVIVQVFISVLCLCLILWIYDSWSYYFDERTLFPWEWFSWVMVSDQTQLFFLDVPFTRCTLESPGNEEIKAEVHVSKVEPCQSLEWQDCQHVNRGNAKLRSNQWLMIWVLHCVSRICKATRPSSCMPLGRRLGYDWRRSENKVSWLFVPDHSIVCPVTNLL